MSSSKQLASRIREVYHNGKWIANTNLREQLENTSLEQATKAVGTLNTIALLCFHLNYYLEGLLHVLRGGTLNMTDKLSFEAPVIHSEDDWKQLVGRLLNNSTEFAAAIENISDSQLNDPFVDEKYGTWLRNVEGVIEHSYYHLGQIVLIRKLIIG